MPLDNTGIGSYLTLPLRGVRSKPSIIVAAENWVLTRELGGAYKRGPFGVGQVGWPLGMLIEIVEKREGMRGRRPDQRDAGGAA